MNKGCMECILPCTSHCLASLPGFAQDWTRFALSFHPYYLVLTSNVVIVSLNFQGMRKNLLRNGGNGEFLIEGIRKH